VTEFWRYMVRCYEHGYHVERRRGDIGPFWTVCKALSRLGFIRGPEACFYRECRWEWCFWTPTFVPFGDRGAMLVIRFRERLRSW
jgi:hypothetical protein